MDPNTCRLYTERASSHNKYSMRFFWDSAVDYPPLNRLPPRCSTFSKANPRADYWLIWSTPSRSKWAFARDGNMY